MCALNSAAIIAASVVGLISCGRQTPVGADIIRTNGKIFTGGDAGFVQALGGRLVIPGINDAHLHSITLVRPMAGRLKLDSMDPICAQVIATLKTGLAKTP